MGVEFYSASIAFSDGETTYRRIPAESLAEAKKVARKIAEALERKYTSIEVWL